MSDRIHLVVTCTNRKKVAPAANCRVRDLGSAHGAVERWIGRLSSAGRTVLTRDLYSGDHWSVARRLVEPSDVSGWVISAGYGLVPWTAPLKPYSATFESGHADSVGSSKLELNTWWQRLAEWPGPVPNQPRSLAHLVERFPEDRFLVVISRSYARAVQNDLRAAATVAGKGRLMVLSAGLGSGTVLDSVLLPASTRMQLQVGGARQALNIRIAARLFERLGAKRFTAVAASDQLGEMLETSGAIPTWDRKKLSDDEVRAFITKAIAKTPKSARTPLLRRLRASGCACEQSRFKDLFTEVTNGR